VKARFAHSGVANSRASRHFPAAMTDTTANARRTAHNTTFAVLFAISFCHLLNDMMQALLPAIYPTLKQDFHLNFTQVGLITLAYQITASLLQPMVG
jgi:FSR family fosmidomycin resistance protein-like MFS transporter